MPPSPSADNYRNRYFALALKAGISALIICLLAYKLNWASLARTFSELHLGLTASAFILLNIGQSFSSWRWMILAKPLGFTDTYSRYRTLFYIGTFFNLFLPTSIGGDAVRGWMLAGGKSRRLAAFGSVIADRVAGVTAMLLMACLATMAPMGNSPWWVPVLPWFILGGLFLTMCMLPMLSGYSAKVKTLLVGLGWDQGRWNAWWSAVGISFIVQTLATAQVILVGLAMELPVPWYTYIVVVPLVSLLMMLPISLSGHGVREGGLILLLAPYGVSSEQATALGIVWFALSAGVGLIGGLVYLVADHSAIPTQNNLSEEGKDSHESVTRDSDEGRAGQRQAAA